MKKKFRIYFQKVNQCFYDVEAVDSIYAIRKAARLWLQDNGEPILMEYHEQSRGRNPMENNAGWEKEFDEKFHCIQAGCDNTGSIANQVGEDEWEQQQCQYCFEIRLPTKAFILQTLSDQRRKDREALERYFFDKDIPFNWVSSNIKENVYSMIHALYAEEEPPCK